jgi:Phosphatidylglycerophosphate synthase
MEPVERIRATCELYLRQAITPVVHLLVRLRIAPNQVTIASFLLTLISVGLLMSGNWITSGILFLLASSCDLIDGTLARLDNQTTAFGKFLDSTVDRASEGVMLTAISYHFAQQANAPAVAAVFLALLGGMLTSYIRARAETLGISCKIGWVTRPERVLLIGIGLLFNVLTTAMYLLGALTLYTATQRVIHVYKTLRTPNGEQPR